MRTESTDSLLPSTSRDPQARFEAAATARPVHRDGGLVRASLGFAAVSLLGFGLVYAAATASLGGLLFPGQATGSLILQDGKVVGSAWVAQPFVGDPYFQSRPSAANYDPMAMAGSNQARSNPDAQQRIAEARAAVAAREGVAPQAVPGDLVTQSGSGMDPHISPAAAEIQVARVARARGLDPARVRAAVAAYTEAAQFGVLGAPRVHVLQLNLALDTMRP